MKRTVAVSLVIALCLSAFVLGGCYRKELPENQKIDLGNIDHEQTATGDVITDEVTTPLEGATELDASIRMGAGQIRLEAGGSDALVADFEYRPKSLKPDVTYEVVGANPAVGSLSVEQPDQSGFWFTNSTNSWVLGLARDIPLDLEVDLGAGEGDLILGGLGLRDLQVTMGAGDVMVDLSGAWDHDVTADLKAGVGQLTLRLPADVGVRVETHKSGIGDFVADAGFTENDGVFTNRAYGETTPTIEISVQRGIGEVKLETVR